MLLGDCRGSSSSSKLEAVACNAEAAIGQEALMTATTMGGNSAVREFVQKVPDSSARLLPRPTQARDYSYLGYRKYA